MKCTEIVGIFGGSFSPPHIGHVNAARAFAEAEHLDKLLIVPVFQPPHKSFDQIIDPSHRLNMCRLAFEDIKCAEVSDCELLRGGKSYTSETLEYFTKEGRRLVFLCGTDMFLTLDTWHEFKKIFSLAKIAFIRRENSTSKELLDRKAEEYRNLYNAEISEIILPATEISSTDIRRSIRTGDFETEYLCPEVAKYIKENEIYR